MPRRAWKTQMTSSETQRGLVFFLLYLFFFPRLNAWAQRLLLGDAETPVAEANLVYYVFLFSLALFIFWSFLKADFFTLLDWLPENLFGIFTGLIAAGVLHFLVRLLPFPVADPIAIQYAQEFSAAPIATLALILLLIPVVEEILFRGLVQGTLRGYSRPMSMVVSMLLYAFCAVWRYALERSDPRYLLLAVLYLPLSAALSWCYDNAGSVWGCAVLHGGLNGIVLLLAV